MSTPNPNSTQTPLSVWVSNADQISGGGGGGGGGAITVADGADVTLGAKGDTAATSSSASWSVIALLKGLYALLSGNLAIGTLPAVSGTVTANAGTNLNTSALATAAAQGAVADTAAGNSTGSWSSIALLKGLYALLASTLNVAVTNLPSATTGTLQSAATANGNGTPFSISSASTILVGIQASSTANMTINFEGSGDSVPNWIAKSGNQFGGTPSTASSIAILNSGSATVTYFEFEVAAFLQFRARISNWVAGSVTITISASPNTYAHKNVNARTNAQRGTGILHRSAVSAVDKVLPPSSGVSAAGITGGSLVSGTTYYYTVLPLNTHGPAGPTNAGMVLSGTPGGSNTAIRMTFAQITGATKYAIFLSTDVASPKWVGEITEAQRASGIIISAVGTYTAGGSAGSVDIYNVGTGLQSNTAQWISNNAYTPESITAINCTGNSLAHVFIRVNVTDLRANTALTIVPFLYNTLAGIWHQALPQPLTLLVGDGSSLLQDFWLPVDGANGLVVLINALTGQGVTIDMWVELA